MSSSRGSATGSTSSRCSSWCIARATTRCPQDRRRRPDHPPRGVVGLRGRRRGPVRPSARPSDHRCHPRLDDGRPGGGRDRRRAGLRDGRAGDLRDLLRDLLPAGDRRLYPDTRPLRRTSSDRPTARSRPLARSRFIIGPAIGGLIIAASDLALAFVINALTFAIVAAILWTLPPSRPKERGATADEAEAAGPIEAAPTSDGPAPPEAPAPSTLRRIVRPIFGSRCSTPSVASCMAD